VRTWQEIKNGQRKNPLAGVFKVLIGASAESLKD
jgi:hypothetical protein